MKLEAYAKVNFTLEVLGRRGDGYHELRSVVLPVSLADAIEITEDDEISSDSGYGENDLAVKAARALAASAGVDRGARIHIEKKIPVGGGLGGGSADAAATLVALNEIWRTGLSREELSEIASAVGSDVPALTLGGAVLMEGRGERVSRVESVGVDLVVANPGVECSTATVYSACRSFHREVSPSAAMIDALAKGDLTAIAGSLMNDLERPATSLCPAIGRLSDDIRSLGAKGVLMSGSGSSVFGIFSSQSDAAAAAMSLRKMNYGAWSCRTI